MNLTYRPSYCFSKWLSLLVNLVYNIAILPIVQNADVARF
jgi:hypothetical protein